MQVSLHDVHHTLVELDSLRFGEMNVQDAIREIVRTTHAMFAVDGAGVMLADADHHLRNVAVSDERFAHLEEMADPPPGRACVDAFDNNTDPGQQAWAPCFRHGTGHIHRLRNHLAHHPDKAIPAAWQPGAHQASERSCAPSPRHHRTRQPLRD